MKITFLGAAEGVTNMAKMGSSGFRVRLIWAGTEQYLNPHHTHIPPCIIYD